MAYDRRYDALRRVASLGVEDELIAIDRTGDDGETVRIRVQDLVGAGISTASKLRVVSQGAAYPSVIASGAPTVTDAVSDPVASGWYPMTETQAFRYLGGNVGLAGQNFPNNLFYSWFANSGFRASPPSSFTAGGVEWMTDADTCKFYTKGNAGRYRVIVDGQLVSASVAQVASDGAGHLVSIAFGSAKPTGRRIRLETSDNFFFGGVSVSPIYSVWRPAIATPLRMVVAGDSYTEGTGAGAGMLSWAHYMAGFLGIEDVVACGIGGTGYLATNNGTQFNLLERFQPDIIPLSPNILYTSMGINDSAFTNAQIQAAVQSYASQVRAALPNVLHFVQGPWDPHGASGPDRRDAIFNGALAGDSRIVTIDNIAEGWQSTQPGNTGNPQGLGNGDINLGPDNTHPSVVGHSNLGRRPADAIKRAIAVLP